jgi:hypothetical protein
MADGKSIFTSQQHITPNRLSSVTYDGTTTTTTVGSFVNTNLDNEEKIKTLEARIELLECQIEDATNGR